MWIPQAPHAGRLRRHLESCITGREIEPLATSHQPQVTGRVYFGDNLPLLRGMPSDGIDLIYVDPPFNTGRAQSRTRLRTVRDPDGDRTGFQGQRYRTERLATRAFDDAFDDYLGFLEPRLIEAHRLLAATGSLYLHLDYREVHYAKVLLDGIFGREGFLNEIIWAYDYGGRTKKKWPPKHDNILVYAKDPERYYFDTDEVERIPYMAPGLVGPEKAARGKLPTDTWWHTIVPTNGKERTGYPTQKPVGIARRIIQASCPPGGTVMDFFAGSGTVGEAAHALGRRFILIDDNPEALAVMARRFADYADVEFVGFDAATYRSKARKAAVGAEGQSRPIETRSRLASVSAALDSSLRSE